MSFDTLDEFKEKAPDLEALNKKLRKMQQLAKYTTLGAALVFIIGCLILIAIINFRWLNEYTGFLIGAGLVLAVAEVLVVITAAYFCLKIEMYKADILCKKQIENGKGLLTVDKLRSCWPFLLLAYLVLLIFMVLINNYGSSIKRFMPFRNSQNQELAAAFMLSLFWIVAGLLTLWAAIWQSLRVYVSAYIEEENEKKTVICWQNFQIQWIYVGLCFIFWFVVNKFLNYRFSNFEIDKYLLPLMAIIFFFLICRFIGAALLYWYIKRRTYDGL